MGIWHRVILYSGVKVLISIPGLYPLGSPGILPLPSPLPRLGQPETSPDIAVSPLGWGFGGLDCFRLRTLL